MSPLSPCLWHQLGRVARACLAIRVRFPSRRHVGLRSLKIQGIACSFCLTIALVGVHGTVTVCGPQEFSVSGRRGVGLAFDRWRRLFPGNRLSWLVFKCAIRAVVCLACVRSANSGHVATCSGRVCGELWCSACQSPQWSRRFAVDAEVLIHKCTVYFVQPNRTDRSGDPSSEWPLP